MTLLDRLVDALVRRSPEKWAFPWALVDNAQRDALPVTQQLRARLAVERGMRVGDVGAGVGYWTAKLATIVGEGGHVIATERSPRVFASLANNARALPNVTVRFALPSRLGLRRGDDLDVVALINMFAFVEGATRSNRRYLREARRALRPSGRLVVFADAVHTTAWNPPFGKRLSRDQSRPREIVDDARPLFDVVSLDEIVAGPPEVGKEPGYLLVLRAL